MSVHIVVFEKNIDEGHFDVCREVWAMWSLQRENSYGDIGSVPCNQPYEQTRFL